MTVDNSQKREDNSSVGYLTQFGGMNAGYVADLIERYLQDPAAVPDQDRDLLHSVDAALGRATFDREVAGGGVDVRRLSRLLAYIAAIRDFGYRAARIDPLDLKPRREPLLDPATHGITDEDEQVPAAQAIAVAGGAGALRFGANARDLTATLRDVYCGTVGYEFSHIRSTEEKAWLRLAVESGRYRSYITPEQKVKLLDLLTRAEGFEQFLHKAFPGQRWYSLEGCEALVVLLDQIVLQAAYSGVSNVVVGMAHRGRLNLLTHIFGKPYAAILQEFHHGAFEAEADFHGDSGWMTDVKYHMGARTVREVNGAADVSAVLLPNPSHLELINPVVVGAVRALQDQARDSEQSLSSMGLLIHGDAAFSAEGVVAETLNLAGLPGYTTGGTVHIILNNQLGFTTDPADSFSTEHTSDIARGFDVPVVHVNADDIEACVAVAKLAIAYRQRFRKDFLVDLVGYRRFGHNETDEPSFTQPLMYRAIEAHPSVRTIWAQKVVAEGAIRQDQSDALLVDVQSELQRIKQSIDAEQAGHRNGSNGTRQTSSGGLADFSTGASMDLLKAINETISVPPQGFTPHPRITRVLERRQAAFGESRGIDWAHSEALAFGTILKSGTPVRLTGQDTARGTFSQRHAVLHDYETGDRFVPLSRFDAPFHVFNSPLSEQAALGYEYGYSVQAPESLVIWEAQFGDFINNAQSIVDEFVASGRAKWGQKSGLVMLLPHGYEGQGANHSYAHLHRFLALAANDNMRIVYPTVSSQYFHLLRQQAAENSDDVRPLVLMAPKSLLRHPLAACSPGDLADGTFRPLIVDSRGPADSPGRLILCTGKVWADLVSSDEYQKSGPVTVIRLEQLYPFPERELAETLVQRLPVTSIIWLQEEPQNRGAWAFVRPKLESILGDRSQAIEYVGRPPMASPSEGAHWAHKANQDKLIKRALGAA